MSFARRSRSFFGVASLLGLLASQGCKRASPPAPSAASSATQPSAPPASTTQSAAHRETVVVGQLPEGSRLLHGKERALLLAGSRFYLLDAQGAHQDPAFHRGVPQGTFERDHTALSGFFPGPLWLQVSRDDGRPMDTFQRDADQWKQVKTLHADEELLGVTSTGDGLAVALVAEGSGSLHLLRGNARSNSLLKLRDRKLSRDGRPLVGLPSGHLFVVGVGEHMGATRGQVERWSPAGESVVDALPDGPVPPSGALGIAARSPEDAYVFSMSSGSYLAHFDGKVWRREKVLNDLVVHDLIATEGGAFYLATEGPLFRKNKGESAWSEVPLPQCGEVLSMAVVSGRLWAIGKQHGEGIVLFGPELPDKSISFP